MSDPIGSCLTYLRTHTLEEAGQNNLLPMEHPGILTRAASLVTGWLAGSEEPPTLGSRVHALATQILSRSPTLLGDADLLPLRKIHIYPDLPTDLKDRIFQIGVRMGLSNMQADASKVEEITTLVDRSSHPYILRGIELLAPANRTEATLRALVALFKVIPIEQKQAILHLLGRLPASHYNAVITAIQPSLIERTMGEFRIEILHALVACPSDECASIVHFSSFLMTDALEERDSILRVVTHLSKDHRQTIVMNSLSFMGGITNGKSRRYILQVVGQLFGSLPLEQWKSVTAHALPLMAYIPDGSYRGSVLLAMGRMPTDVRIAFASLLVEMAQKNRLPFLVQILQKIPKEHVFTQDTLLILHSLVLNVPAPLLQAIIVRIILIEPARRVEALGTLLDASRASILTDKTIFSTLFETYPTLSEASYGYLLAEFATNTNAAYVHYLAVLIQGWQEDLQLFEEHPLVQAVIKAEACSEPEALKKPENPYTLYKRLKEQSGVPIELHPPFAEVAGRRVTVCVQPLVETARAIKKAMIFSQMPPAVTPHTLIALFQQMDARFNALEPVQKAQVLVQIHANSGASYVTLQQKMLYDPYLQRLLHTTGAPTDRVPLDVMQFFTILQFVLDKPDTLEPGALLTPREDALMKVAASIDSCEGGKEQGVDAAYNWIQGQAATASSFNRRKVETYVYPIIYRVLSTLLSEDTLLMKQLTGSWNVDHTAHQAIYLKNLLGKTLGLVWDLMFDGGTGMLYKPLLQKSIEEILDAFFVHFSPSALVDALQAQVNRDLSTARSIDAIESEKANSLYNLLFHALDENQSYWTAELDEDGLPKSIALTKDGAMQLLIKSGYLQVAT